MTNTHMKCRFAIIGGGIAGTSCLENLIAQTKQNVTQFDEEESRTFAILVTENDMVKVARDVKHLTYRISHFNVENIGTDGFISSKSESDSVTIVKARVSAVDVENSLILLQNHDDTKSIEFVKLCICSGGSPHIPEVFKKNIPESGHDNMFVIRDEQSVSRLCERIQDFGMIGKSAQKCRICVIGNGGIASEIIHELLASRKKSFSSGVSELHWIIKDDNISSVFLDCGASQFFIESSLNKSESDNIESNPNDSKKLHNWKIFKLEESENSDIMGCALGPLWTTYLTNKSSKHPFVDQKFKIHYNSEVVDMNRGKVDNSTILEIRSHSSDSSTFSLNCDLVILATGVESNKIPFLEKKSADTISSHLVNSRMQCLNEGEKNVAFQNIFAAGDCCWIRRSSSMKSNWFQMRLWTQARIMGLHAGTCMYSDDYVLDSMPFELFVHVTSFFGYNVILLGLFKPELAKEKSAQYPSSIEYLVRCTPYLEYIKLVLLKCGGDSIESEKKKVIGAVLVGDTGLEETVENLILNEVDVSGMEEQLLDPNLDIEDYFD